MLELERTQVGKRRLERELLAVAAVDARHERLDDPLVRLRPEPTRHERRDRLVPVLDRRRERALRLEPCKSLRREQRAVRERVEIGRDHPREPLREPMQLAADPDERARELRTPADEPDREGELLAEPDAARLAREEAVRGTLDEETVDLLREELPSEPLGALDERDLAVRHQHLEAARGGEPRDSPSDDHELRHATGAPGSHAAERARTSSASASMNTGSSLSAGGRSRRIPTLVRSPPRLHVNVEEDLDVVGDESDRHGDDVADPALGERDEVVAEVRPRPRLGRAARRLVRPRPALLGDSRALRDEARGLAALGVVRVAGGEDALGKAVRAEDDVDAVALVRGPA